MAQDSPAPRSPPEAPKRPKGILKNSVSYQNNSPEAMNISPTSERPSMPNESAVADGTPSNRPTMPARQVSEKELTQMNTEINAGEHRRHSSNPRGSISRRQSSTSAVADGTQDESNMRLKWDEANLYLNEGQMGGKMKIDEPKTPYASRYDPMEDEEEISGINAQELAVDELDMEKGGKHNPPQQSKRGPKDGDIPGLDLGEPEMEPVARKESDGDRQVIIDSDDMDVDGVGHHGEGEEDMSAAEKAKHRKFEQMRRKHYEMHNVKNLLGHTEELDEDDDGEAKR
ncbi:hypothetical protein LTR37_019317 [Vermiconidia calcicola]|uniref:Uncharacterized protein n=1 Tax=Vermiconidia calcicola TaxID=1690605 RepID=A0ACC3MEJ6_9PEZI|nr:hypothetical protein LTR37_019317 [Vermiconidia calcicola]